MDDDLILYTNPQSRGRIARWMLEEVGRPYRTEVLEYGPGMKSPEYLSINPMGKVPALRHGSQVVTECAAICAYLAAAFPEAGLGPEPEERGGYYRWLFFAAGPLEAAVTDSKILGVEPGDDKRPMVGYGSYGMVMDTLEDALRRNAYAAGDRFTAADVYLGAHVVWGLGFGTIEERPIFQSYAERVSERDAYQRATALDDALAQR